jgi:hypothetical protein
MRGRLEAIQYTFMKLVNYRNKSAHKGDFGVAVSSIPRLNKAALID